MDRQILRLAVPAFAALVAEPLFLLADSAIVGHLGTLPLAGLGVAGSILAATVGIYVFLAYGTTAAVARRLGAGDLPGAITQGVDGIWLAAGLGVVTAVAGWLSAPWLVTVLGASPDSHPYAVSYLHWSLPGLPAMLVVLAATGILRGLQDTRTPLYVAVLGAGGNVVLNVVLVYGAGLGIAGAALGTSIAQLGMGAAFLVVVVRAARRHGASLRPDLPGIRQAGRAGVPLVVRTIALRAALLVTTAVAARQGDVALAAHQVVFTLWMFMVFALDALAIAAQALTGHALGAGDRDGARAATRRMIAWGVWFGTACGVILIATRTLLPPLFTGETAVRDAIAAAIVVVALSQPLAGYVFVIDGVLIGAGDGPYLAKAAAVTLVGYLPMAALVAVFSPGGTAGLIWLWVAFGVGFMVVRGATLGWRQRQDDWLVTGSHR